MKIKLDKWVITYVSIKYNHQFTGEYYIEYDNTHFWMHGPGEIGKDKKVEFDKMADWCKFWVTCQNKSIWKLVI